MNQAKEHGVDQQPRRILQRDEPSCRDCDLLAEERPGDDIHNVAKIAAEHNAPEDRRQAAPEKQLQALFQALAHPREFQKANAAGQGYDQAVGRVREHQAEEEDAEARRDKRWVDLPLARQAEGGQDALADGAEFVVLQQHRHIRIRVRFLQLC